MFLRSLAFIAVTACAGLGAPPVFEAASIKPAKPPAAMERMPGESRSFKFDPGRIAFTYVTLRDCLRQAWNLKDYQIEAPKTMTAARFDIVATAGAAATEDRMRLMLRSLLIERFQMQVHMETRDLPVLALVPGRKLRLQSSAADTPFAKGLDGGNLFYRHISMDQFAEVLSGFKKIPVLDNTGLSGFYDVKLDIFEDPADMSKTMIDGSFGDAAAATVESQLGLRMEPRRSPLPMLIVEKAEKTPIEN